MNTELYNKNKEIIEKVVNRISKSTDLYYHASTWRFDSDLFIERYNNLFKITFKGVVLGHYHCEDKVCPEYNEFFDKIYYAIENKKEELKNKAIFEL